ncbi:MAG: exodeoxyribonuclease VII large subunit [Alphaproteobacteria bacterium]
MSDLPIFSVSEFSFEFKKIIEQAFGKVKIKGEVFGFKKADSGHCYLSLKDDNSALSAVCWKGVYNNLPVKLEDGMEIIAIGKISTFPSKSSYQLVIESVEVAGQGVLLKLLEERKKKFLELGYFDANKKKKIPYIPNKIGIVTSQSGAVIRDIIHRIRDRFPLPLLVVPTPVQGQGAEIKIANAINLLNNLDNPPDVIIVARGGGSLEDLWCFNEEAVIEAVYQSKIPIISAVGHETDTMLIDYVSDLRAPTPTGAAEMAVPVKRELEVMLLNTNSRLISGVDRFINEKKTRLEGLSRGIPNLNQILLEISQKLDDKSLRLNLAYNNLFSRLSEKINTLGQRLESVSFENVLKRGYAIVKKEDKVVTTVKNAKGELNITFADGNITVGNGVLDVPQSKKKKAKEQPKNQLGLFE